jgi:hypothetical protein
MKAHRRHRRSGTVTVQEVHEAIQRIGRLMYDRSPAFADEFAPDGMLVGSEPGEIALGREAIRQMIGTFHALPARYSWTWSSIEASVEGRSAWLFAEGFAVKELDGDQTRRPYRLSGVLSLENGKWCWRLFHGSEPKIVT